jgi:hypothetical protein
MPRSLQALLALLLVGEALGTRPCEQAAGGKPCPDNDAVTLANYLTTTGGLHRHSHNLNMDEQAYNEQQNFHLHPVVPTAAALRTPGPTPAGVM